MAGTSEHEREPLPISKDDSRNPFMQKKKLVFNEEAVYTRGCCEYTVPDNATFVIFYAETQPVKEVVVGHVNEAKHSIDDLLILSSITPQHTCMQMAPVKVCLIIDPAGIQPRARYVYDHMKDLVGADTLFRAGTYIPKTSQGKPVENTLMVLVNDAQYSINSINLSALKSIKSQK